MSDEDFRTAFEAGRIPLRDFGHRGHLRMAFVYIRRLGEEKAVPVVSAAIRTFATRAFRAHIYDDALTRRWIARVAAAIRKQPNAVEFRSFLARSPELLRKKAT